MMATASTTGSPFQSIAVNGMATIGGGKMGGGESKTGGTWNSLRFAKLATFKEKSVCVKWRLS